MSSEMITCASCDRPMPAYVRFCPECGYANASVMPAEASPYSMPPPGPQPAAPATWQEPQGYNQTQNFQQPGAQPQPPAPFYGPPPPYNYRQAGAGAPPRDPTVALLLELLGYVGFLGIGHIYAGRIGRGIGLMVAWWFWGIIAFLLTFVLIGCFMFLAWPVVPILSGLWAKNDVDRDNVAARGTY